MSVGKIIAAIAAAVMLQTSHASQPNVVGIWKMQAKFLLESHYKPGDKNLSKAFKVIDYHVTIDQEDEFFRMTLSRDLGNAASQDFNASKDEVFFCYFEPTSTLAKARFWCSDRDEPVIISGKVTGKHMYMNYIEPGMRMKAAGATNPLSLGYYVGTHELK